jgi:hypothetical protein
MGRRASAGTFFLRRRFQLFSSVTSGTAIGGFSRLLLLIFIRGRTAMMRNSLEMHGPANCVPEVASARELDDDVLDTVGGGTGAFWGSIIAPIIGTRIGRAIGNAVSDGADAA